MGMLTDVGMDDMAVVGIDVVMVVDMENSAMELSITVVAVVEAEGSMGMLVPMSGRRFREAAGRTSRARGAAGGC
jgi:hypothetical protein